MIGSDMMASMSIDMFIDPDQDPRGDAPLRGDERETLTGFLRWQRMTLELKCAGLTSEQLARRAVPPSSISLLGMIRHLADVERGWFRRRLAGQDAKPLFRSKASPDGDFDDVVPTGEAVAEAWAAWRTEVAFTDDFIAAAPDLDVAAEEEWRGAISLRWILVHMIEEYARHNGHVDLLREQIDGAVGQ